jgi:lipopolysaccharide biosynthesis protein
MKRVAIFAHYDAQGEVKPYILQYLRDLRETCAQIIFVSTGDLPESQLEQARAFCSSATRRANAGFDFGMWRQALEGLDLAGIDELVLTNSSVFGPIYPLTPILEKMAQAECDFWGMTDSFEIDWHLQSYFLVFKKRALASPALTEFFGAVLPYASKDQVIRSYELGLTQFLSERGLRPAAFVPMGSWVASARGKAKLCARRQNATVFYPIQLIRAGMPFVKVQLLRDNPVDVPLAPVLSAMRARGFDMSNVVFDRPPLPRKSFRDALRDRINPTPTQPKVPKQ